MCLKYLLTCHPFELPCTLTVVDEKWVLDKALVVREERHESRVDSTGNEGHETHDASVALLDSAARMTIHTETSKRSRPIPRPRANAASLSSIRS